MVGVFLLLNILIIPIKVLFLINIGSFIFLVAERDRIPFINKIRSFIAFLNRLPVVTHF